MRTTRATAMLTTLVAVVVSAAAASCGGGGDQQATAPAPPGAQQQPRETGAAPPPEPVADGPCPYLDEGIVEQANGQRVGAVRISADRPDPACFFERGDGSEQLRTWVVETTPEAARATVDAAAPVVTSDLAELPGGWSGGSQPTEEGAVFAVANNGTAVVVTTNQPQTFKARQVAEQVIANLSL